MPALIRILPLRCRPASGRLERGQVAILAMFLIVIFVILGIGAIDVYRIYEVRTWASQAAQRAAAQSVTTAVDLARGERPTGMDLTPCAGYVTLDLILAEEYASKTMSSYLLSRADQFSGPATLYVFASNTQGEVVSFPDSPSRGYDNNPASGRLFLGAGADWVVDEPSVAVAGVIPVSTFLGSVVGLSTVDVTYFATASVSQPDNVCLP